MPRSTLGDDIVRFLDRFFDYVPPLPKRTPQDAADSTEAPSPIAQKDPTAIEPTALAGDVPDVSIQEQIAAGSHTPMLPGPPGVGGALTPEQRLHVLQAHQMPDVDPLASALDKGLNFVEAKAATIGIASAGAFAAGGGFAAAGGTAAGAASSVGGAAQSVALGLQAAAPVAAFTTVAGGLTIAAIDILGGDVAIPTYAPLNPEFDASTAAGRFHGTQEALQ